MAPKNDRQEAVSKAVKAWAAAPMHIKAMAGAYVGPLLAALQAMSREMDGFKGSNSGCGLNGTPGPAAHGVEREEVAHD